MAVDERGAVPGERRRRALVAGIVAVGLAVATAVAATTAVSSRSGGDGDATAPPPTTVTTVTTARVARRQVHEFTAAYTGPVWLTVTVEDGAEHELELTWGPWRRWIRQREPGPVTYWFEKKDPVSVPVWVEVPAGASASFGEGAALPAGAVDARPGWSRRPAANAN